MDRVGLQVQQTFYFALKRLREAVIWQTRERVLAILLASVLQLQKTTGLIGQNEVNRSFAVQYSHDRAFQLNFEHYLVLNSGKLEILRIILDC